MMKLVDMSLEPKEAQETYFPTPADQPKYPYGLSISLCDNELEKLEIDFDDICVGDLVHLHAMAMVTSKSCNETEGDGQKCRVELQICYLSGENEADEDDEAEDRMSSSKIISKLYK